MSRIFDYYPSEWVPWKGISREEFERVRNIKREEIEKHANPDFHIRVVPDDMIEHIWLTDIYRRMKASDEEDKKTVFILPNPAPLYKRLAYLINETRINLRNVVIFAMDEWANQDGVIAPEEWPHGLFHALMEYFWNNIDPELRMPREQVQGITNENLEAYGKMIEDEGDADVCYTGPGWTGHLAFIDPGAPEFEGDFEEWKKMGPRIVTLNPFTLAQQSLFGGFGMSGDLSVIPSKGATIGPKEIIAAKERFDWNYFVVDGTNVSWQRFVTRLAGHGPVTPYVPTSLHQTLKTNFYISENAAQNVEPIWEKAY